MKDLQFYEIIIDFLFLDIKKGNYALNTIANVLYFKIKHTFFINSWTIPIIFQLSAYIYFLNFSYLNIVTIMQIMRQLLRLCWCRWGWNTFIYIFIFDLIVITHTKICLREKSLKSTVPNTFVTENTV